MLRLTSTFIAAALLAGCTPSQGLFVERGVLSAQSAKDAEGRVLKATVCAMSIGAYHRINTDRERAALDVLCGGGKDGG